MEIKTILTSAVIAGLVAAYVSLRSLWAKIAVENITKERTKWRDKIRERSIHVHRAIIENDANKLGELRAELTLLLNPLDSNDVAILNSIKASDDNESQAREFSERIALLLKHDWERAKLEATPIFARTKLGYKWYKKLWQEAKRSEYEKT